VSFVEDFKKILEGEQETDSRVQVNNKMKLAKLYSQLARLMSEEPINMESILFTLEDIEEKMLDVIQLLEDLAVTYEKNGDKQNLAHTAEEIDKVT